MSYTLKSILFWFISFLLMASAAIYQRTTGPTYPVRGTIVIDNEEIKYRLIRTWEGDTKAEVKIKVINEQILGKYRFKRFKSHDECSEPIPMQRDGEMLVAKLPNLPPAGKIQYEVFLGKENNLTLVTKKTLILRYKGVVPQWALIPHIIVMFLAMMFATRTGFEALIKGKYLKNYALFTVILFGFGGFLFGPIMQKYAFGVYWAGWPFGTDLTDNKSLATFVIWLIAWLQIRKNPNRRWWVYAAVVVLFITFIIPHSTMGSEIDFTQTEAPPAIN